MAEQVNQGGMTHDTPTPLTDALNQQHSEELNRYGRSLGDQYIEMREHAGTLERRLSEAQEKIARVEASRNSFFDRWIEAQRCATAAEAQVRELREALRNARRGLASALLWALDIQGGYTKDDEKYFKWAGAIAEAEGGDPTREEVIDAGISALDAILTKEQK